MAQGLEGAGALVTGASSGIGEATARMLARRGAMVALVARRRDRLERLAAEIGDAGGRALVVEADVTRAERAREAVETAAAGLGRLDVVVNNAGMMLLGPVEGAPLDEWERMVSVNVMGLLYVAHAALPHLLEAARRSERRVADLVNVSSVAGRVARPPLAVYNLTKHGVGAFSEALRQEVTARYLRVSLVEPGMVATELTTHVRPEILESFRASRQPMEPLQAEDVAETIEFIVTRPRRVAVNEVLVRPTEQVA